MPCGAHPGGVPQRVVPRAGANLGLDCLQSAASGCRHAMIPIDQEPFPSDVEDDNRREGFEYRGVLLYPGDVEVRLGIDGCVGE